MGNKDFTVIKDVDSKEVGSIVAATMQDLWNGNDGSSKKQKRVLELLVEQRTSGGPTARKDLQSTEQQIQSTVEAAERLNKTLYNKRNSSIGRLKNFKPPKDLFKEIIEQFGEFTASDSQSSRQKIASTFWNKVNAYQAMMGISQDEVMGQLENTLKTKKEYAWSPEFTQSFQALKTDFPNKVQNTVQEYAQDFQAAVTIGINEGTDVLVNAITEAGDYLKGAGQGEKAIQDLHFDEMFNNVDVLELLQETLNNQFSSVATSYNNQIKSAKALMNDKTLSMPQRSAAFEAIRALRDNDLLQFAQHIQETDAATINGIAEERAILYKEFERVGNEIVNKDLNINVTDQINKFKPDTLVHTHQFDEELDNLRFSFSDIQTMITSNIREMILLCGNEIMSLDMTDVRDEDIQGLYRNLRDMYIAVVSSFGGQISEDNKGSLKIDSSNLSKQAKNQMTQVLNHWVSSYITALGGQVTFDKADFAQQRWISSSMRNNLVTPDELKRTGMFIDTFNSSSSLSSAIQELKNLQKTAPYIPQQGQAASDSGALLDALKEEEAARDGVADAANRQAAATANANNQSNSSASVSQKTAEQIKKEFEAKDLIPIKNIPLKKGDYGVTKQDKSIPGIENAIKTIETKMQYALEDAEQAFNEEQDTVKFEEKGQMYQILHSLREHFSKRLNELIEQDIQKQLSAKEKMFEANGVFEDASKILKDNSSYQDVLGTIKNGEGNESVFKTALEILQTARNDSIQSREYALQGLKDYYQYGKPIENDYASEYLQYAQNIARLDQEIEAIQSQYDEYMAQRAAEEAAAKEQEKAAAEQAFKPLSQKEMRDKLLNMDVYDRIPVSTDTTKEMMQTWGVSDNNEDYISLQDKINGILQGAQRAKEAYHQTLEALTQLYNSFEGDIDTEPNAGKFNELLVKWEKQSNASIQLQNYANSLQEQLADMFVSPKESILSEVKDHVGEMDQSLVNLNPEELFKNWGAEKFADDQEKTIQSFSEALQRFKEYQEQKQTRLSDELVELYQGAQTLGRDPWQDVDVLQTASKLQYYDEGVKIFEEEIAKLQQAKTEADKAAQQQMTNSAFTETNSKQFEQMAQDITVLVEAVQNLQKAFTALDQSTGAKGLLDALSNISTLLQQGLSSQITEYTDKTKQLFDLNREFSTALTKSGEPATAQVNQWIQQEWTDVSKFDNLQWNIQQFETLQKIAQSTGFAMDEFQKRYKSITTETKATSILAEQPKTEWADNLLTKIGQIHEVLRDLVGTFQQLSTAFGTIDDESGVTNLLSQLQQISESLDSGLVDKLQNLKITIGGASNNFNNQIPSITRTAAQKIKKLNETFAEQFTGRTMTGALGEWATGQMYFSDSDYKKMSANDKLSYQQGQFNLLAQAAREAGIEWSKFEQEYQAILAKFDSDVKSQTNQSVQPIKGLFEQKDSNGLESYVSQLDLIIERLETIANLVSTAFGTGTIFNKDTEGNTLVKDVDWSKANPTVPDLTSEKGGFSNLNGILDEIVGKLQTKNTLIDEEIKKAEAIQGEAASFEPLQTVLETIDSALTSIVTKLPNVKVPSSVASIGNTNEANNVNGNAVPNNAGVSSGSNNQISNSLTSSGSNTPTPQNPLPVAVYASPAGTIKSQQGYSNVEGSTFVKRTGWASEQAYQYVKDEEDNIVLEKFGNERMNYDSLSKQIAKVDEQILKLDHDMAQIQNKYPNIDLTPWKQQRTALGEMRKSMLQEARDYGYLPEYEPSYKQFKQQRLQNINKVIADLNKSANIASEKELLEVQKKQSQLQQRAASIHAGLHGTSQYQDVLSQIASATSLTDIENAEKALNRLKATIEQLKGQAKNVSGSLDPLQNMFKTRDLKGQFYIDELITKFEKLGLNGKAKVAPLQGILDQWNEIDINALDVGDGTGRNGLQAFGDYVESFNKQRYMLEAEAKAIKAQQQVNAKQTKDEKRMDVDNYKQLLAAIQNVTDAQRRLQAVQKEAAKDQSGMVDYTKKIDDARIHLDLMKESLQSILDTIYGKTSLDDLTADFFTNPTNGNLLNTDSLSPSQLRAFGKAHAQMTGTEEQYNASQLKAVASAYDDVTKAVAAYNKAASDITKSSDIQLMGNLQTQVETTSKSYYDLIQNVKQLIPEFTPILDQWKQDNPIRGLFDTKAISDTFLTRLEFVKESLQGLADVHILDGTTAAGQISQIDDIANNFKGALASSKSTTDIFNAFNQANTDLQNIKVEPFLNDLLKVQSVLVSLGDEARGNVWTDHLNKIGQVLNNMLNTTDPDQIQAYRNQLNSLLDTAKEIANPTLMQNKQGFLLDQGQVKNAADMTAQMDKYAESMQLGSLMTEKWSENNTKVTRTYKTTSGQITQLTGQVEKLSSAWRMSSTVSQGTNAFMTGFSKSIGGVIRQLPILIMGYSAVMKLRSVFAAGMNTFKEYDSTLTNISYTMNMTSKELDSLGKSAIDMAKDLSMSVSNAEGVYKIYANMNTSAEEIQKLAKPTVILSNLSGVDASTAADEVQGIIQQFDMLKDAESDAADVSMHVVDVLNDISANVAMDYSFN